MDRTAVLTLIAEHDADLQRFGVRQLYLFGSVARDSSSSESDIDMLVEFENETPTFRQHMGLLMFLEQLFGVRVDLATRRMITNEFAEGVAADLIRVA